MTVFDQQNLCRVGKNSLWVYGKVQSPVWNLAVAVQLTLMRGKATCFEHFELTIVGTACREGTNPCSSMRVNFCSARAPFFSALPAQRASCGTEGTKCIVPRPNHPRILGTRCPSVLVAEGQTDTFWRPTTGSGRPGMPGSSPIGRQSFYELGWLCPRSIPNPSRFTQPLREI